jgi:ribonuclease BN (tRNA processing enzyme)
VAKDNANAIIQKQSTVMAGLSRNVLTCVFALALAPLVLATSACAEMPKLTTCTSNNEVTLQVLGSGGPIADDGRASSSYLVWVNGKSRILIDAGGGSFLRFGEARASFSELAFVGISHFHTDHSAAFPALLKSGSFSDQRDVINVAGPSGGGVFPGLVEFVNTLLNDENGVYAYLSAYRDGRRGFAKLAMHEVNDSASASRLVFEDAAEDIQIHAMRVPHGIVPALAFRVRVGGAVLVFSGDQNGLDPLFVNFAKNADILVMHMPIPEDATGVAIALHAKPSLIGKIAAEANAKSLLLSHFMARSLRDLDKNVEQVKGNYSGSVLLADDLSCYSPGND